MAAAAEAIPCDNLLTTNSVLFCRRLKRQPVLFEEPGAETCARFGITRLQVACSKPFLHSCSICVFSYADIFLVCLCRCGIYSSS
ncbi:hypothetical protein CLOP_g1178 [Closterium sp. NIES-67]|nr:hypothetical protein CLOP_g1178 [Closterium sp. NIES-67]